MHQNIKWDAPKSITYIYLLLLITGYLFFTGANGYAEIQTAKYKAFLILNGGYAALIYILEIKMALLGTGMRPRLRSIIKGLDWTQRFVVVYMLLTWISAFSSTYWPETIIGATRFEGALTISLYCICFLFVSIYGIIDRRFFIVLCAAALFFCILCIFQLLDQNPFGLYPAGYSYSGANKDYGGAYLGTVGNVDLVAGLLCLIIPITVVPFLRGQAKNRFALLPVIIILFYVLAVMNVSAGIVGVAVGLIIGLLFIFPWKSRERKSLSLFLSAAVIGLVALLYLIEPGAGFVREVHEILHGRFDDSFGSGRIQIWRNVLVTIPGNIWFGIGPDTMIHLGITPFTRLDPSSGMMIVSEIDVAHNEYLNVLSQQGVFAFISYLAIVFSLAAKWIRNRGESIAVSTLGCAALCYCIQAFFGFSSCITAPYFWVVLALLEKECSIQSASEGKKNE